MRCCLNTQREKYEKNSIRAACRGKKLKANTDYTVKYSNNIAAGRAKVTITGKGGYKGTVVKYFKILPAKQQILRRVVRYSESKDQVSAALRR